MGWIQRNIGYMQQVLWNVGCMCVSSYFPQAERPSWQLFERITRIALGAMGLLYTLDFFSPFLPLTFKAVAEGIFVPILGCLCISLILGTLKRGYQFMARPCAAAPLRIHNNGLDSSNSINQDNRLLPPPQLEESLPISDSGTISNHPNERVCATEPHLPEGAINPSKNKRTRFGYEEWQEYEVSRGDRASETDMTKRKIKKIKKLDKVARCLLPEFEEVAKQEGLC